MLSKSVRVAESINWDLIKVTDWCDLSGMKLILNKTKTMIVSRSSQSPPLTLGGIVLKKSDDLHVFGVTFDSKIFEKLLCLVSRITSQSLTWYLEVLVSI